MKQAERGEKMANREPIGLAIICYLIGALLLGYFAIRQAGATTRAEVSPLSVEIIGKGIPNPTRTILIHIVRKSAEVLHSKYILTVRKESDSEITNLKFTRKSVPPIVLLIGGFLFYCGLKKNGCSTGSVLLFVGGQLLLFGCLGLLFNGF